MRSTAVLAALAMLIAIPADAADDVSNGKLSYRGFIVDISSIQNTSNFTAILGSLRYQLDIVADCGARPDIIDFFRGRDIVLVGFLEGGTPGLFGPNQGVAYIVANMLQPEQPIIRHELLHAYQYYMLPGGNQNRDVSLYFSPCERSHISRY